MMTVAVLITCHNRRAHTLNCLRSLFAQKDLPSLDLRLTVWLVDDASTDGTAAAVAAEFPEVRIIAGSGDLFWCPGMALAWKHAADAEPDVFLWLNDDVTLRPEALAGLHRVARENPGAVVIGSCASPTTSARSYGGLRRLGAHPGKLQPIEPSADMPVSCDTFEGNVVWVPAATFVKVGSLAAYQHAMGDIDYGYRVVKAGLPLLVAPGFFGECSSNSRKGSWEDPTLSRRQRLKKLRGIKGLPPRDWWRFCKNHGGLLAPLYFVTPVLRVLAGR